MALDRYQVFLSFRGLDTRRGFADHLHTSLERAGICTYRDCDDLERGEAIDAELEKAIKESRLAIIVFSPNYASSKWCLMELVKILHEKRNTGLKVLPVFHNVQPTDVRSQTGSFKTAFENHERENAETEEGQRKVNDWRVALKEVANLGGKVLENENDGYESKFVQEIVEYVKVKLHQDVWNGWIYLRLDYFFKYLSQFITAVASLSALFCLVVLFIKVPDMIQNSNDKSLDMATKFLDMEQNMMQNMGQNMGHNMGQNSDTKFLDMMQN